MQSAFQNILRRKSAFFHILGKKSTSISTDHFYTKLFEQSRTYDLHLLFKLCLSNCSRSFMHGLKRLEKTPSTGQHASTLHIFIAIRTS